MGNQQDIHLCIDILQLARLVAHCRETITFKGKLYNYRYIKLGKKPEQPSFESFCRFTPPKVGRDR